MSRYAGKTWRKFAAPGQRDWNPDFDKGTPRWVEPVAWDASGALYYLWGSQKGLWAARSLDQGESWASWHLVDRDEVSYFPYLIARGRGELVATWSSGKDETLQAHLAAINLEERNAPPQIIESPAFQTDTWSRVSKDQPEGPVHRAPACE